MDITWYLVQPSPSLQIAIAIILNQILLYFLFQHHKILSLWIQILFVTVSHKRSRFRHHGEASASETFGPSTLDARGMVARHDGGHVSVHDHAHHCEYATKGASAQTHSHRGSIPCLIDQCSFWLTSDATTAYHRRAQRLFHIL